MDSNIQHGKWTFDDDRKKTYAYDNDINFNLYKCDDIVNIYNDNELNIGTFRRASVIHKLVRTELRKMIISGVKFSELMDKTDEMLHKFIKPEENGGLAFPLGISVNNIAAHDTAFANDDRTLKKNDIVKIDLGVHIGGRIIDSAFTVIVEGDEHFVCNYQPLLDSTSDATFTGIKEMRPDARLYEVSEKIEEVINSYELTDGTPIKPIFGLGGHNVLPYKVHGDKLILSKPHASQQGKKVVADEIYAIETFASTGNGTIKQMSVDSCTHFMLKDNFNKISKSKNPVVKWAQKTNNNLPFTQYQCSKHSITNYNRHIQEGIKKSEIVAYPVMSDISNTYTSQFEHTIHIKDKCVEILSLGKDY